MIINDIDISSFNAQVSSKLIQPTEINVTSDKVENSYFLLNEKENMKKLEIKILFQDVTRDKVYKDISNFMLQFKDEAIIKFNNLKHKFKVFLVENSTEETSFEEWLYVNITVQGYEYSELVTHEFNLTNTASIENVGNSVSPCIIEITPTVIDLEDFIITGLSDDPIKIATLRKGKKVIINSIVGSVTCEGINKYGDTDMWEFPVINLETNNISFSRNTCNITIKYFPRYF